MCSYADIKEIHAADVLDLSQKLTGGKRLLVASNRGPIQFVVERGGTPRARRGAGGVVTALGALQRYLPVTWVAAAMSAGDRLAASQAGGWVRTEDDNLAIRFVTVPRASFRKHYEVFSNSVLWFLQHYLWGPAFYPTIDRTVYDAWERGYRPTNQAFAEALVLETREGGSSLVMLHDYHLYLVAGELRRTLKSVLLQHFIHIPWPDPSYWTLLPAEMRQAIFAGLCANDIVGFQIPRFAENFLRGCRQFLPGASVDWSELAVRYNGNRTLARAYPISIDVEGLERTMRSAQVRRLIDTLQRYCGQQTIVRVDRLEPSKNLIRGFKAFDLLLRRHPEFRGKVKFLAFLVPSRTSLREYKYYTHETMRAIEEVNASYGTAHWKPIELFYQDNYGQALAGLSLYDVLLVNPIMDGMNLVSKEGPTVNTRNGVLVLSEGAGSFEQLQGGALAVAAADLEGTARALHQALTMPAPERARRAALLRAAVAEEDLERWLLHQLRDLAELVQRKREAGAVFT